MPESPSRSRLWSRLLAAGLGTLTALVLVEVGLRLTGIGFNVAQQSSIREASDSEGVIRVLCVGESVTALGGDSSYPSLLNDVLDERTEPGRYVVMNAAIPGSWSGQMVDRVEEDLPYFRPDYLVAMIGANDYVPPLVDPLAELESSSLWEHLRIYRVARMAMWQLAHPERGASEQVSPEEDWYRSRIIEDTGNVPLHYHYAWLLLDEGRAEDALATLEAAHRLEPESGETAFMLGLCCERLDRPDEAETWYAKALTLETVGRTVPGPIVEGNLEVHDLGDLARIYQQRAAGDLSLALAASEVAAAHLPGDPRSWTNLAVTADSAGDEERSIEAWHKAAELQPGEPAHRLALARVLARKDPAAAEAEVRRVLAERPESPEALVALARLQIEEGRWEEAEATAQRVADGAPSTEAFLVLAEVAEATGRQELAEDLLRRAFEETRGCASAEILVGHLAARGRRTEALDVIDSIPPGEGKGGLGRCRHALRSLAAQGDFYGEATPRLRESYARLHTLLAPSEATLVAVQYPTLPVQPLRRVLPDDPEILVVDNEASFRAAVWREGYEAVFTDRGYGTFGHGTARGNRLIAENVAAVILAHGEARATDP